MSIIKEDSELTDDFIIRIIIMIQELYEGENWVEKILNSKIKKRESFVLFDKDWLEKWKSIVGYEELKEKLIILRTMEDIKKEINEVRDFFLKLNTKQKLYELGKMDSSKLKKLSGKKRLLLNEDSDFIPILSHHFAYFIHNIDGVIQINSEISNGIIYIYDPFPEKNKEQKLILLYKQNEKSKNFNKTIITVEPEIKIRDKIRELSRKSIDEILNQNEYHIKIYDKKGETKSMNENNFLKEKNQILSEESEETYKLKIELMKLKEENAILKKKLGEEIEKNKMQEERIKSLETQMMGENDELKNYISNNNNNNSNKNMIISNKAGEKIISVLFMTMGNQDIMNYSMPCKTTDLFVKLEEKLYNDFPQYRNYDTYFEVNTRRIKRFKTIEENKIKNNDIICLFVFEE